MRQFLGGLAVTEDFRFLDDKVRNAAEKTEEAGKNLKARRERNGKRFYI